MRAAFGWCGCEEKEPKKSDNIKREGREKEKKREKKRENREREEENENGGDE